MARDNKNMHKAKSEKNDEFYTLLTDIEKEMKYYKNQFRDKVVYCNCDDARESNFFKYFSMNFEHLGLKRLITTSYNANGKGTILIYEGDKNGNKQVDDEEIIVGELNGNGDFRSEECLQILQEADIVVTNPPFSLFREYINVLMNFNKKFCIIGNQNAITYIDVFKHIKEGKLWLGITMNGSNRYFQIPDHYPMTEKTCKIENGKKYAFVNGVVWFTNLVTNKAENAPTLIKNYNPIDYPTYDNYNAINVNKITDVPYDYDGVIGVPITAIHKICDDGLIHFDTPMRERESCIQDCWSDDYYKSNRGQFWLSIHQGKEDICKGINSIYKIVKFRKGNDDKDLAINGKTPYFRILIQRIN